MNIGDTLDRNAIYFPDGDAIVYGGAALTYREFREKAKRAASGFARLGVKRGDKVALFLSNCPEFLISYYGCQYLGAVCVSISALSKADEVRYMVNDSEAVLLVSEESHAAEIPSRSDMPGLKALLMIDGEGGDARFTPLLAESDPSGPTPSFHRDEPAAIIYTSGTTGRPKGVVLSHGNVVSNTTAIKHITGMRPEDRGICPIPIYHTFAQNHICNSLIQAGAAIILHKKFDLEEVLESLLVNRVTIWHAVPPIYIMVLNHPDTELVNRAMAKVRYSFSAAATMPVEVAARWKARFGLDVHEGYGLTETSPMSVYNHEYRHKAGSVGTPICNVEVIIADADGNEVPRGESGEILIRGPNVMLGYYKRQEETAKVMVNGFLRSGDIGYMDEEGYVFIVDRLKDMINSAGLKVWPREVEEILYTHPNVKECAVIGVPHDVYGESVKAVISLKNPEATTEKEIMEYCGERLAQYKVPRFVEFMAELPKGATGKIFKLALKKREAGQS